MDYAASGNPRLAKDLARQKDPNVRTGKVAKPKGSTKANPRHTPSKEDLLARMKAAADAKREG